jgi:hypothetical protein
MGHVQDMKGSYKPLSHYNRLLYQQTMVWSTSRRPGAGPGRTPSRGRSAAVVAIGVGSPVARLGADWRRRREARAAVGAVGAVDAVCVLGAGYKLSESEV